MEFLRSYRHRSLINEILYISLNIGLAVTLMVIVNVTGLIWPSLILVVLSMWRIFVVRLQFWFANIQANLVSVIVSTSYVVFLYVVKTQGFSEFNTWIVMLILAALYACWLLILKPLSKRKYIVMQAGLALFIGVTALYMISYNWIATPVVLIMWLIGYAVARHTISSYDDEDRVVLVSLAWALVMAELGWIGFHWTMAYKLPVLTSVAVPQISIIALCVGLLSYKIYNSIYHFKKVRLNDILVPLIFVVAIILVLVIGFNGVTNVAI